MKRFQVRFEPIAVLISFSMCRIGVAIGKDSEGIGLLAIWANEDGGSVNETGSATSTIRSCSEIRNSGCGVEVLWWTCARYLLGHLKSKVRQEFENILRQIWASWMLKSRFSTAISRLITPTGTFPALNQDLERDFRILPSLLPNLWRPRHRLEVSLRKMVQSNGATWNGVDPYLRWKTFFELRSNI